jgi:hypothetical protein
MYTVVVLNSNWQYWSEVNIKKVVKWLALKKIEVVLEKEDEVIRGVSITIKMPLVVRLKELVQYTIRHNSNRWSKQAVFNRDDNCCQYWHFEHGKRFIYRCTEEERTYDHVIPKDYGGPKTYENTVTCCRWHNEIVKKNRTPEEAGLVLIRKPTSPVPRKGEVVVRFRFRYNPNKLAHKYYVEQLCSGIVPA